MKLDTKAIRARWRNAIDNYLEYEVHVDSCLTPDAVCDDVPALCSRVEELEAALEDALRLAMECDDDLSTDFNERFGCAEDTLVGDK